MSNKNQVVAGGFRADDIEPGTFRQDVRPGTFRRDTTEEEFRDRLLRQIQEDIRGLEEDIEAVESGKQISCLPVNRIMAIALNKHDATEEEKDHYRQCLTCLRFLFNGAASIVHPPDALLYQHYPPKPAAREYSEAEIRNHMETRGCTVCRERLDLAD